MTPNQQNLPKTTTQYPNWKRKMGYTLEQLCEDPRVRELAGRCRGMDRRVGKGDFFLMSILLESIRVLW